MRTSLKSPDTMVVADKPAYLWTLAGILCVAMSLLLIAGLAGGNKDAAVAGGIGLSASLVCLLAVENVVYELDRRSRHLRWKRGRLLKQETGTLPLESIERALIKEHNPGDPTVYWYMVSLVLADGTSLELTNRLMTRTEARETAEKVHAFLGIPGEVEVQASLFRQSRSV